MRIGIDIDDTITDSWQTFKPFYAKTFGVGLDELEKTKPYYSSVKDKYTLDEYFKMVGPIYDSVSPIIPMKKDARETINKLHKLGHGVILITSRGKGFTDSYELTKEYLNRNKVYYDKLLVNIQDKASASVKEGINLFIDDSYRHCCEVSKRGIDVLMMNNSYNKEYKKFKKVNNWQEIYEYIVSR